MITAFSGNDGVLLTGGAALAALNNGTASGELMPTGILMHREIHRFLPNYAFPSPEVITGQHRYSVVRGGTYPDMLQDNILSINLQMTWSADSGDAINC